MRNPWRSRWELISPENSILCFIQTYYGQEEVRVPVAGKLIEVIAKQGDRVQKGDLIAFLK